MRRGKTDVETAILNNWSIGAVLRGHEEWSDGRGVWSTIRITPELVSETTITYSVPIRKHTEEWRP